MAAPVQIITPNERCRQRIDGGKWLLPGITCGPLSGRTSRRDNKIFERWSIEDCWRGRHTDAAKSTIILAGIDSIRRNQRVPSAICLPDCPSTATALPRTMMTNFDYIFSFFRCCSARLIKRQIEGNRRKSVCCSLLPEMLNQMAQSAGWELDQQAYSDNRPGTNPFCRTYPCCTCYDDVEYIYT